GVSAAPPLCPAPRAPPFPSPHPPAPSTPAIGTFPANVLAAVSWALMAGVFQPTLRHYRLSPLWGGALPLIAAVYVAFTLDSAYQHWRGRGGLWKGRVQAISARQ